MNHALKGNIMKISLESNIKKAVEAMDGLEKRDIPYIERTATNNLAFDAMESVRGEITGKLKIRGKKVPNSIRVKKASKTKSYAELYVDEWSWQHKVLAHHFYGGDRERKGMEKAMAYLGLMKKSEILTPSPGVKIRSHTYVEMMSQLKLNVKAGYSANETKASRKRRETLRGKGVRYFVITGRSSSPMAPGVYAKIPGRDSPACMLRISERPTYKKRFDLRKTVGKVYKRRASKHVSDALARAKSIREKW